MMKACFSHDFTFIVFNWPKLSEAASAIKFLIFAAVFILQIYCISNIDYHVCKIAVFIFPLLFYTVLTCVKANTLQ